MSNPYKERVHIKIGCEEEGDEKVKRGDDNITPSKCDFASETSESTLLRVKKSISFSTVDAPLSRENSSDSFIHREVEKKDLFFPVDRVKFQDMYDWSQPEQRNMLQARSGTKVTCNNKKIALFRHADQVFAIDERCPHLGGPLHMGDIESIGEANLLCVVCPWHKWRLDLTTGKVKIPNRSGKDRNIVYPTRVNTEGTIFIGFSEIDTTYFNGDAEF